PESGGSRSFRARRSSSWCSRSTCSATGCAMRSIRSSAEAAAAAPAQTRAAAVLTVANLAVEFPTRHGILAAVHDVSFDIAHGEVLGVVGESGAGKSLTGAAIIGLIDPPGRISGGEIRLDGRRIDNLPYEAMRKVRGRMIGAIFQ